jgi:hypothetical protein
MGKVALALALALAHVAPGSATSCPVFFHAKVEDGLLTRLTVPDLGCQERPSTIGFNPIVKSASRRYLPCSSEGAPIQMEHFSAPGCVGAPLRVVTEVGSGTCTARISQVYQVENGGENHCAAFFPDTSKMPLNQATVSPKVDYYAPGQCRKLASTISIGGPDGDVVGAASSGSWACNADGSVTYRKFASTNCTGSSIAITLPKSPSGCNEVTSIEHAEVGKGACVSVCASSPNVPLPPSSPPSTITVSLPPSLPPSSSPGAVAVGGTAGGPTSSGTLLAVPLVLHAWITARLLQL